MTTKTDRVVAFGEQADGTRGFAVVVRGLKVLVRAERGQHDVGRALAETIAALGPAANPVSVPEHRASVAPIMRLWIPPPTFAVGQRVWCTVHGAEGEHTVTAVGSDHHRGQIKISGERMWCPIHNFQPIEAAR